MANAKVVWIEVQSRASDYRLNTFRGRVSSKDLERLLGGDPMKFLRLSKGYWYHAPSGDEESKSDMGLFERFGDGQWANFTGEVFIRCETIVSVALLKKGLDGEPKRPAKVERP